MFIRSLRKIGNTSVHFTEVVSVGLDVFDNAKTLHLVPLAAGSLVSSREHFFTNQFRCI